MAQIWLPLKHEPTGRQVTIYIPGASELDRSQLQEIIQSQTEKFEQESKLLGPKPKRRYSQAEVGKALKEFREYTLRRRQSSSGKIYF